MRMQMASRVEYPCRQCRQSVSTSRSQSSRSTASMLPGQVVNPYCTCSHRCPVFQQLSGRSLRGHRPHASCSCAWPSSPPREPRIDGLPAAVRRMRPAVGHPIRQRCSLRQSQCLVQSLQALRLVAQARHRHRTHQTRPSPAERPPRAHAPHPQDRDHPPAGLNSLQQQARFDDFRQEFNSERPHEALAMRCPAENFIEPRADLTKACRTSHTRSTIATSSSPPAAASACIERRSTSRPSSPANGSASRRSTTASGSSASCATISDTSI